MPRVTAVDLPEQSLLNRRIKPGDFIDCYRVNSKLSPRKAAEIICTFPAWAELLVSIRGVLTRPFGLSNEGPEADDKLGAFPVEYESDYELIAGFDDKHQDFRVSVIADDGHVYLATWAHQHNVAGKLYIRAIMPFHILIARNALNRVYKNGSTGLQSKSSKL